MNSCPTRAKRTAPCALEIRRHLTRAVTALALFAAVAGLTSAPARAQTGLAFNSASSQCVTFGTASSLCASSYTVECWFRRDGTGATTSTGNGGWAAIVPLVTKGRGEAESPANLNMNYFLGIRSDGRLAADFEEGAGPNHPLGGVTAIQNGTWYHAAVTFNAATGRYVLYLNGAVEKDTTLTGGITPASTSIQHAGLATAMTSDGTRAGYFTGVLDEARIWNYARTQVEIQSAMSLEIVAPQAGLLGRWGLNEGTGTIAYNCVPTGPNGTLVSTPTWVTAAPAAAVLPLAPGGLSVTAPLPTSAHLSWVENSCNESSFAIERSTTGSGGPFSPLATVGANVTTYDDNGLTGSTEYCYRVQASNSTGNSGWTTAVCVTTPAQILPPNAPSNLVVTTPTWAHVHVSWSDNSDNETGLELERSTTGIGGTYTLLAALPANTLSYDDQTARASTEYCYRVRAVNGAGASGYAGPGCATTPAESGTALDLGGSSTYVTFGQAPALGLQQFTIECWFRRDGTGSTTQTGSGGIASALPLVTKGAPQADGSNVDMNWFLGIDVTTPASPRLGADFEDYASGANHPVTGTTTIASGVWYHAAATYDGTTWKLYLNGVLDAQQALAAMPRYDSIQHGGLGTALTSSGGTNGLFDGALDEVRVWNYARSQSEIAAAINSQLTSPQTGLVARWGLGEGSGTTVHSTAGTAVNGAIMGAAYTWGPGAPFDIVITPPPAPTGLTASAIAGCDGLRIAWSDNSGTETAFEIERSTTGPGGPFTALATLGANVTSYDDGGLTPAGEYCYRVRATNAGGPSGWAGPACATALARTTTGLDLGGTNAYVTFGADPSLGLPQFTIETWFRRDGAGATANTGTGGVYAIPLVTKGRGEAEASNVDMNWFLGIRGTDNVLCADFEEGAAGAVPGQNHPVFGVTPLPVASSAWHHAAATYDGNTWKLYLDGNLEATLAVSRPTRSDCIQHAGLGTALSSTGVAEGYFDGALDEARVWNYARSQAEIQSTINQQITAAQDGLVARWSLDEGTGTAVNGSAGTAVNGTVTGTAYAWACGAPFNINMAPAPPVVIAPLNDATGVSTAPALQVAVSDPNGGTVDVTFYGRQVAITPPVPDFSIVVLPDAQNYTNATRGDPYPQILTSQTQWVVDSLLSRNIAYVTQVGDLAENGDTYELEWQRANTSFSLLENPATTGLPYGVPYGIAVGNHDQSPNGDAAGTTTFYNQYFGEARFAGRPYYGGHYGSNNDNHFDLFSASGMDFLVIYLEYDTAPDAPVLDWADALLKAYPTRRGIVVSQYLMAPSENGAFSSQGQATYDALKDNPNLFLMLCGHLSEEGKRTDVYNGNTVYTLLADYQNRTLGGNGWLRILRFTPTADLIQVSTYSPYINQFETDANSRFTLPYDMPATAPVPYTVLGTVSGVPSGTTASLTWPGLDPATPYEWYAAASDGALTTAGAASKFTTGDHYPLIVTVSGQGSVTKTPDQVNYEPGSVVSLAATPDPGYRFAGWSGDASGSANPLSVTMDAPKSIIAAFEPDEFPLTINVVGSGSVTKNPDLTSFPDGSTVELTAVPGIGNRFVSWSGDLTGSVNPATLTMDAAKTVTATFALNTYTLTYAAGAHGTISGASSQTVTHGGSGTTVTAVPDPGYRFVIWSDGLPTASRTETNVTADLSVTATFAIDSYTITASAGVGGTISPSGSVAVAFGGSQTFVITADPGYAILDVVVDQVSRGPLTTYTFSDVAADHEIAASFASAGTVAAGPAPGLITLNTPTVTVPVTITRSSSTPALMAFSVVFTASAPLAMAGGRSGIKLPPGGGFLNADGGRTLGFQTIDLGGGQYQADGTTMGVANCGSSALTGTLFTVDVTSAAVGGTGTITINSVSLRDCDNQDIVPALGAYATVTVDRSAPTVAVLVPNGGETWFVGEDKTISWTGVDPEGVESYEVAYSPTGGEPFTLLGTVSGTESSLPWTVAGMPTAAARVRVTAHDVNGNSASDLSDNPFTVSAYHTITASAGPGGSITPSGAVSVAHGASQAFAVVPSAGYHILDVLVDAESQGPVESYTFSGVTTDHTISATFAINTYALTVAVFGPGAVTKDPELVTYDHGATVQLTASPQAGAYFVGWGGAATGSASPVGVYMDGNKSVTATFATIPQPVAHLTATQVTTGNPPGNTTGITLAWDATVAGTTVEVWRAGFGHYPEYDDEGGAAPEQPAAHEPAAPWVKVGEVEGPGATLTDSPFGRDVYYYVAYTKDSYGTWSHATPMTDGTLNYHLGDVVGPPPDYLLGDNQVVTADISALGSVYGFDCGALPQFSHLDVGPTTNRQVHGRPLTDDVLGFEDLIMFALNYAAVSAPQVLASEGAAGGDVLLLEAPARVTGGTVGAKLTLRGSGSLLALSTKLTWDPAVVQPVSHVAGEWLTSQGGVAFSPAPGTVDAAVMGRPGMSGEGELATVTFRVLAVGDPKIAIGTLDGRNALNQDVAVQAQQVVVAAEVPTVTRLGLAKPNPFRETLAISFSLAARGAVDVALYSVDGRRVRTLVQGTQEPGEYDLVWDGRDDGGRTVAAGVYYMHLATPAGHFTRTVTYLK